MISLYFSSELEKRHFMLEFHCNLTIKGQYEAIGRILLFPINGRGDAKIKLSKLPYVEMGLVLINQSYFLPHHASRYNS